MSISNANKQSVCEKYRSYLEIIYHFGNKVMLMKQLYQYAELMGLAKNFSTFYSGIIELVHNEVLKKETFTAFGKKTQLQMLTLRKYGIRFIEGKQDSYSVASVPRSNGNERILVSIFKNCYILKKLVPRIQKEGKKVTFDTIKNMLERDYSTILLNKNQAIFFMTKLRNDTTLQHLLNVSNVDYDMRRIQEIKQKLAEGLRKGSESTEGKGKGRLYSSSTSPIDDLKNETVIQAERGLTKAEKLDNYTVETMLAFNAHVAQIKFIQNRANVTVLIFDIHNKTNIYRMVTHIACMYLMFRRYFKEDLFLRVGIVSIDEFASKNLKAQAESTFIDFISKERKGTRLSAILSDWGVDALMQERIEVQFTDYNITNDFMDGIKHANLMRR
ncbi:hypothetical protein SD70_24780 [Gordoniibacillus kamchatkensis]|uniref:Uncharacterized protein n=1 Tax=Gordoniibacillus kamchatkensis TaxID=1590651 RepID=A0ABR5AC86_9BACL|nr:hypothetical protein [Paenibacillus sp. VKM B-2647]KIL38670.1 hypothetical protein SD70_24780 [Paenibacillus sp. VKM B-2647]